MNSFAISFLCGVFDLPYFYYNKKKISWLKDILKLLLRLIGRKLFIVFYPSHAGRSLETMSGEFKISFVKYFPNLNLHVLLDNNMKIGSFFRYKSIITVRMQFSLVYEYSCVWCASAYVGMTSYDFCLRVGHYRSRSHR
jgi:hypothetical protein